MPRQYQRKSLRATAYTPEDLRSAVERVRSNELTNYAASKIYGIPTSTLNDHVKKKSGLVSQTLGRALAIPIEMENKLASCIRTLEKWGWGLSRNEILDITAEFVKSNNIKTPFKNNRPGPDWFISFRKRHNLSIKKPQSVEYLRKRMTDPFVINEYFTLLKETLFELGINEPERIWNLDETSVCLDPTKTKIVGGIGVPSTRTTKGTGKENVTVLTTVSAAGTKLSPLIIFKGKNVYYEWMSKTRQREYDFELSYAASKRGWIETDIFFNYMDRIILPKLADGRPVLIIYDGHSTHVDVNVVALAVKNNVTILKLPAHTSHLLQPLDLAVFKSFKTNWDKKLVTWQRQNVGLALRKQVFAEMFAEAWHEVSPNTIRNGFRKGGIYPYNENVIPEEKYDPAALKRWKDRKMSEKKLALVKTLKIISMEAVNKNIFCTTSILTKQNVMSDTADNVKQPQSKYNLSFEELLLRKVAQNYQNIGNQKSAKLTRAAKGSEVITQTYLEKMRGKEIQDTQPPNTNLIKTSASQPNDEEKPGPSRISRNRPKNMNPILTPQPNYNKNVSLSNLSKKESKNNTKVTELGDRMSINVSKKGKGIGKKTGRIVEKNEPEKNEENESLISKKHIIKKSAKKSKRSTSATTTSESGEISTHSDSDIIDAPSDNFSEIDIEKENLEEKITVRKLSKPIVNTTDEKSNLTLNPPSQLINKTDQIKSEKVTILSSVRYKPENTAFIGKCAPLECKSIDLSFDLLRHSKRQYTPDSFADKENKPIKISRKSRKTNQINLNENFEEVFRRKDNKGSQNDRECSVTKTKKEKYTKEANTYDIGDTVLARYHNKGWKYYVGVIKQINVETKKFFVCYYKTIGKNENVKFVVPKRKDEDWVTENLIVKQIELLQIKEDPAEFILMNDEVDAIYF